MGSWRRYSAVVDSLPVVLVLLWTSWASSVQYSVTGPSTGSSQLYSGSPHLPNDPSQLTSAPSQPSNGPSQPSNGPSHHTNGPSSHISASGETHHPSHDTTVLGITTTAHQPPAPVVVLPPRGEVVVSAPFSQLSVPRSNEVPPPEGGVGSSDVDIVLVSNSGSGSGGDGGDDGHDTGWFFSLDALRGSQPVSVGRRLGRAHSSDSYEKWRYRVAEGTGRGNSRGSYELEKSDSDGSKRSLNLNVRNVDGKNVFVSKKHNISRVNISNVANFGDVVPLNGQLVRSMSPKVHRQRPNNHRRHRHHYGRNRAASAATNAARRNKMSLAERRRLSWRRRQSSSSGGVRRVIGHHGGRRGGVGGGRGGYTRGGAVNNKIGGVVVNHHRRVSISTKTETIHQANIIPIGMDTSSQGSSIGRYPGRKYFSSRGSSDSSSGSSNSSGSVRGSPVTPSSGGFYASTSVSPLWVRGPLVSSNVTKTSVTKTYYGYYRHWRGFLRSEYLCYSNKVLMRSLRSSLIKS